MKCKCIILMLTVMLSCGLTSCYLRDPAVVDDFTANYRAWIRFYPMELEKSISLPPVTALRQQTVNLWNAYQDSARNIVLNEEIVYIKRMASSSVMNSPAFYEKHYSGNTITEKGRGAENDDITVFYLSDGTIIKASPKVNPEWLGTLVGEKVLKTVGKKLSPRYRSLSYVPINANLYYDVYDTNTITTTVAFEYKDYVIYQPLYSK